MWRHFAGICLAMAAAAPLAWGAGTGYWELNTRDALAEADAFERVTLTGDGELRLGSDADTLKVEGERQLWCLCRARDGGLYAGTSSGKILRVDGAKAETTFETGELLVTAIVEGRDGLLYASTIPNGKIFRRDAGGTWAVFATPPCKYVWALLPHPDKHLVAATGPEGKLFAIDSAGRFEVLYETGKENILALAMDDGGELVFGTANPGLLFRLSREGKATVVRDFGENEVRVIRPRRNGGLAVGLNSGVKASPASFLGAVQQAAQKSDAKDGAPKPDAPPAEGDKKPGPVAELPPAAAQPAVRGVVVLLGADGRIERAVEFAKSYVTALAVADGGVAVATNNSGRVHRIDDEGKPTLLWDFRENQVLAFAAEGGKVTALATGDAAALHRVKDGPAASGFYQTKAFDAKVAAEWGTLTWKGRGQVAFRTRSGNVAEPDKTWSDWSAPAAGDAVKVASPRGRYLQLKIEWERDPAAVVTGVTVAYLPENQRPRVLEVKVDTAPPQGGPPVPPGGAPPQGVVVPPLPLHSVVKKIAWRAEDPDGEPLVFRLACRAEDAKAWIPLNNGDPVGGAEFLWNTDSMPDGKYVLRVEAGDEPSNAADRALRASRESPPFAIDNHRPEVRIAVQGGAAFAGGGRINGAAEDALSPIQRQEYSVDGGEWRTLFPMDGIFDSKKEEFEFALPALPAGTHTITVRAVDQENNIGAASQTVTTP